MPVKRTGWGVWTWEHCCMEDNNDDEMGIENHMTEVVL